MTDTKPRRSWTILTVDGPRQHGGNTGYQDDPASIYRFDDGVANSRQIGAGDLVFVRDSKALIGVAVIQDVSSAPGVKEQLRCPECGISKIRQRRSMSPAYRCHDGHEFELPVVEEVPTTKYEATYAETFVPAPGAVSGTELRAAAFRPNPQLSIEEVDAALIADAVLRATPSARDILEQFFQGLWPDSVEIKLEDSYSPGIGDKRQQTLVAIKRRRGQKKFRNGLMKRHKARCVVTGCKVADILEAAHIWPYRGEEDNHLQNGLLLRADIHTLFDLDLIGIDPTLRIHLATALQGSEYQPIKGAVMKLALPPSAEAIARRWESFRRKLHFDDAGPDQ